MRGNDLVELHPSYRAALRALEKLYRAHGATPELKAIRDLLRLVRTLELPPRPVHPWVGRGTEEDRAVVEAYRQAWHDFLVDSGDPGL